jgi:hypothetical protein
MDKDREAASDTGTGERASGSVERPIPPDEAQPGDRAELAAGLGGPVDIAPGASRGGLDHPTPGEPARQERTGPEKRRD